MYFVMPEALCVPPTTNHEVLIASQKFHLQNFVLVSVYVYQCWHQLSQVGLLGKQTLCGSLVCGGLSGRILGITNCEREGKEAGLDRGRYCTIIYSH